MDTITITARIESPADNGGREWLAYIDQSTKPVGGCVMGRGSDAVSAARDLERRAQWQIDGDYGHGAYTVAMSPQPEPRTIDCTPSPKQTKRMLQLIIDSSTSIRDRNWARAEMARCFPEPAYELVQDGRDIDRLVSATNGRELRVGYSSAAGKLFICDALAGDILDYFTQDEIDAILTAGSQRPLDTIAGTTVTTINW